MNALIYYVPEKIDAQDIRDVAEKNGYKCTSYTLVWAEGQAITRLNIHFDYEDDEGELQEAFWQCEGGSRYGYEQTRDMIEKFEDWRQERMQKHQPGSGFVIRYHLFSLPYLVQFLVAVMKQYHGWVEDAFSETMYEVSNIDVLPVATAEYLRTTYADSDADSPAD